MLEHVEGGGGNQAVGDLRASEEQQKRRFAFGLLVQVLRARVRLSIEKVSEAARIGHVTWRRIEEGKSVRSATYAALDAYFEWPAGTAQRAVIADEAMVALAQHVGLAAPGSSCEPTAPCDFVDSLARTHRVGATLYGGIRADSVKEFLLLNRPVAPQPDAATKTAVQPDRIRLASELLADLTTDSNRSEAEERLRRELLNYLGALA